MKIGLEPQTLKLINKELGTIRNSIVKNLIEGQLEVAEEKKLISEIIDQQRIV